MAKKDELLARIRETALKARAIADNADKENREMTPAEAAEITAHLKSISDDKGALLLAKADSDMRAKLGALDGDLALGDFVNADVDDVAAKMAAQQALVMAGAGRGQRKSVGQAFVETEEFRTMVKAGSNADGTPRKNVRFESGAAKVKTLITGGSQTQGGALIVPDFIGLQAGLDQFQRPLNVAGMVTNGTTEGDTVEFVQVTGTTNNAAPVAESTTTATPGSPSAATGVKPESAMTLGKKTSVVRQFAHWIPATTRALSDAAQIRTLIDAFLTYGLREELEDQIVNGDGAGEDFDGLLHVSGTQELDATGMNMLQAIRRARTLVRYVGRSIPSAYLMNPYDWERADLLVDNNGRYYFGGPAQLGTPTIWGLQVVESESVPEGTIVCADFRKAILWDRQDQSIQVSSSHADFFIRNMVAILAEDRYAFGVIQPNAFVKCDISVTTGYDE